MIRKPLPNPQNGMILLYTGRMGFPIHIYIHCSYCLLADYEAYIKAQDRVSEVYQVTLDVYAHLTTTCMYVHVHYTCWFVGTIADLYRNLVTTIRLIICALGPRPLADYGGSQHSKVWQVFQWSYHSGVHQRHLGSCALCCAQWHQEEKCRVSGALHLCTAVLINTSSLQQTLANSFADVFLLYTSYILV